MQMFYSESTNSFYPEAFKEDYLVAGTWPKDATEVSEEDFNTYGISVPPYGKVRGYKNGTFVWEDFVPSQEQLISQELFWVSAELLRAGEELEKVQDSDPKAVGTVTEWRNYRKSLRAWKEHLDFPKMDKRPSAPDSIKE